MSFYQRNKTGELMSRATNDLSNVRMLLGPGIMYSANTIVTATVAVAIHAVHRLEADAGVVASDAGRVPRRPVLRQENQCA